MVDYITNKAGQKRPYGFKYAPKTGMLYRSRKHKYDVKGGLGPIMPQKNRKYPSLTFKGKEISFHRFAVLMMDIFLPEGKLGGVGTVVDHKNGNTHDNRWDNLRIVSKRENDQNKASHREGSLCGCHRAKKTKKERWEARIVINKKYHHIGTYDTELEAHQAYLAEASRLNG